MQKLFSLKKIIIGFFSILGFISIFLLFSLKFSFDFSQFFPEGDEDLEFYQDFIKDFGTDDNFLLIAIENKNEEIVFDENFLNRFHNFSTEAKNLPYVTESQSLTTLHYPLKSLFGYTKIPVIRRENPSKYKSDWKKIQKDDLFINSLIDEKGKSLVIALETEDGLNYEQCNQLLTEVRKQLNKKGFNNYHLLGEHFFMKH